MDAKISNADALIPPEGAQKPAGTPVPKEDVESATVKEIAPVTEPWPSGHYYSPIPDYDWLASNPAALRCDPDRSSIPGIDLNVDQQLRTTEEMRRLVKDFDWPDNRGDERRYFSRNTFYGAGSGFFLYAMLMLARPKRVVEVGSGFSSAMMLDTAQYKMQGFEPRFTFIDPEMKRIDQLLRREDRQRCTLIKDIVQNVSLDVFSDLQPGDILFIDSSHVAKTGSDVLMIYNEIIPQLPPGVLIHIHDIYWPFEYPASWRQKRWAWNEVYIVRALLQNNARLSIQLFASYLVRKHPKVLEGLPFQPSFTGSSLWLRVMAG
jgi:predicted O-methyltransferase YrrM